MSDPILKADDEAVWFVCPGCATVMIHGLHRLPLEGTNAWEWNGSLEAPTLRPSVLTRGGPVEGFVCHSFITDGKIEFLSDSTHALSGHTVPLPPLPDWFLK